MPPPPAPPRWGLFDQGGKDATELPDQHGNLMSCSLGDKSPHHQRAPRPLPSHACSQDLDLADRMWLFHLPRLTFGLFVPLLSLL